jgi:hypothetical protein
MSRADEKRGARQRDFRARGKGSIDELLELPPRRLQVPVHDTAPEPQALDLLRHVANIVDADRLF